MVIDGVKEKYNSLKEIGFFPNSSSFILCDCIKKDNKYILNDIIPLDDNLCNIKIDRKDIVITNIDGIILKEFDDNDINSTSIEYVNGNDLLISNYSLIHPKNILKKQYKSLKHYYYDDELENINTIYDENEGKLNKFEFINEDTLLIEKTKDFKKNYRLYSISKKDYISPTFRNLEIVENTKYYILKFEDVLSSSLIINDISYSSKIIGFITSYGKFYNGIYDELTNKEIECELNSKPDFHEYNDLKKMIQGKLNEKVVKDSNKLITKDFIIKKMENKIKNNIK